MSRAGLSELRLRRLHDVLAGYVQRGEIAGLVSVIERRGELHIDCIGCERNAVFRIASMTKPVAAAAAMVLVEEGRLRLDDPATEFLPELADLKVLRRPDSPLDDTVPARRPITLRDLLTFRLGTGLILAEPDTFPIQRAIGEAGVGPGPPDPERYPRPEEWMRNLGSLPLVHQPGEVWMYNTGAEVLGVLVARAAGQAFGDFLTDRIFAPLGMRDTAFFVPRDEIGRLAIDVESERARWAAPPAFESGGGGLVSTADDFLAFSRLMLGGGRVEGKRILSRPSVEAMATDHLTSEQKSRSPWLPDYWQTHGWGFGMTVVTRRFDVASTPGKYGWDGGLGTSWRADPREEMTTILLTPNRWSSPSPPNVLRDFWTLAYSAIDD